MVYTYVHLVYVCMYMSCVWCVVCIACMVCIVCMVCIHVRIRMYGLLGVWGMNGVLVTWCVYISMYMRMCVACKLYVNVC